MATKSVQDILRGYDRQMRIDMARAIADYVACCEENAVAEDSVQSAAMAISLLIELSEVDEKDEAGPKEVESSVRATEKESLRRIGEILSKAKGVAVMLSESMNVPDHFQNSAWGCAHLIDEAVETLPITCR